MSRIAKVEGEVHELRALIDQLVKDGTGHAVAIMRMKAEHFALYSILGEMAERFGVPAATLEEHLQVRADCFLDRILSATEKENPALGALLDDREPDAIPTAKGYQPLFSKGQDQGSR